jgi:hypothetical protein
VKSHKLHTIPHCLEIKRDNVMLDPKPCLYKRNERTLHSIRVAPLAVLTEKRSATTEPVKYPHNEVRILAKEIQCFLCPLKNTACVYFQLEGRK